MILRKGQIWEIRQRLLFHFSYCLGFVGGEEGTEGLWAKVIEDRCGKCLWGSDESNLFLALLFFYYLEMYQMIMPLGMGCVWSVCVNAGLILHSSLL